jgi:hypothetical protein
LKWLAEDRMKMIENNCRPNRLTRFEYFNLNSYTGHTERSDAFLRNTENPNIGGVARG